MLLPGDLEGDGQYGNDPGRPQVEGRPDRNVLQHPTIDVVVVGQWPGREDHGDAGRGERPFDHIDRSGGHAGSGCHGVVFDDVPALGHVAQYPGPQRRDGQP